ncbi:MAG: type II toxin-antitoxin system HicB family antitoxin [Selenomonas sp.]|nr:toxin-antitoxin system HicB family antitoxin [Selenomonas sp.]MCI6085463.1 type II toxin-antitoxin system HicB family antitoxin [Selenomonas sp.]
MPKSLHKKLAERAKREGISLNQYCVYLLSEHHALHAS